MEQNSKYFSKTAHALQELKNAVDELNTAAAIELSSAQALKTDMSMLKTEIRAKAAHIDKIIENLNGALK